MFIFDFEQKMCKLTRIHQEKKKTTTTRHICVYCMSCFSSFFSPKIEINRKKQKKTLLSTKSNIFAVFAAAKKWRNPKCEKNNDREWQLSVWQKQTDKQPVLLFIFLPVMEIFYYCGWNVFFTFQCVYSLSLISYCSQSGKQCVFVFAADAVGLFVICCHHSRWILSFA